MKYYSTNGQAPVADLEKAVVKGLAEDRGLYMPEEIYKLPQAFFDDIQNMKFQDIAYNVASNFFGDDVDGDALQDLVYDTLSFDCPVVKVTDQIYALELFHGPTLAFKDVGARFMARLLQYFLKREVSGSKFQVSDLTIQNTECQVPNSPASQFGVKALMLQAQEVFIQNNGSVSSKPVGLRLIPYYAWNHRGTSRMTVWMANTLGGLGDYQTIENRKQSHGEQ